MEKFKIFDVSFTKKNICEIKIQNKIYPVFELSVDDCVKVDNLVKTNYPESLIVFTMLKMLVPDCPEKYFLAMAYSEALDLLNEIKDVFISNPKNGIDKYPEYFH